MIIQCKECLKKFIAKDSDIPKEGRTVKCGYCSAEWHQMPNIIKTETAKKQEETNIEKNLSVDSIKGSDGKTYKFLGSQWAELLPSGKTGLFAKRKIGKELDKLTGRKSEKIVSKKVKKKLDPSSQNFNNKNQLPDIYKPKENLGFIGYIFLIIIIGFSLVGVLKTFEEDLMNYFPEAVLVFEILNEQLEFLAESVKNIVVIIKDLIESY